MMHKKIARQGIRFLGVLLIGLFMFLLMPMRVSAKSVEQTNGDKSISETDKQEILTTIEEYLNADYEWHNGGRSFQKANKRVLSVMEIRRQGLLGMELRIGAEFTRIQTVPVLESIEYTTPSVAIADVYVTTGIYYRYAGSITEDFAAFGVRHQIGMKQLGDSWMVVSDLFNEEDITGVVSTEENVYISECLSGANCRPDEENGSQINRGILSPSYHSTTTVNNALMYAVGYCGIPMANRRGAVSDEIWGNPSMNPSQYNSNYASFSSGDCANFISQCLKESGVIAEDGTWYYSPNNVYWVEAKKLSEYLIGLGYSHPSISSSSDYSLIYPGNPVYWLYADPALHNGNTGHQMICVGYNSSGVPVLCAHTTDMFRIPVSNFLSYGLKTIQIATNNKHTNHYATAVYYYNSYKHYKICSKCEYRINPQAHTVNLLGNCSVCGAVGPFPAVPE